MPPYQPSEPTRQVQADPASYYPPPSTPSPPQSPPPHQAYQPGTYGQQSGYQQQQPYQQPVTPPYLRISPDARDARRSKGIRDIVFGTVWLTVGLGITVVTFAMMDGAAMIVAWGPALYGVYKIIKGLITVNRSS